MCPNTMATGMFAGAEPVRFTRLLAPEEAAERIVAGIKWKRSLIGVPGSVYLVPLTKALTPIPLLDLFNRIMGIATLSEHTVGRGIERSRALGRKDAGGMRLAGAEPRPTFLL